MNDLNSDGSKRHLARDPESDPLSITTPDVKVPIVIDKASIVDTGEFGTGVRLPDRRTSSPEQPTVEDINE